MAHSDSGTTLEAVWYSWNSASCTSSTSCQDSDDCTDSVVWNSWTNACDFYHGATVWAFWQAQTVEVCVGANTYTPIFTNILDSDQPDFSLKLSRKERRRIKFLRLRQARSAEKRRRKAVFAAEQRRRDEMAAEKRALELFEDVLGEEQRRVFEETGRLLVHGEKYDWLIKCKPNHKIMRLEKDKVIDLCINLVGNHRSLPHADRALAFGLRAKYDEDYMIRTANVLSEISRDRSSKDGIPKCAVM